MLTVLLVFAFVAGISYLATAGLLWVLFWLIGLLGVTLPIVWSWGTAAIIWGIIIVIKALCGGISIKWD